MSLTAGCCRNAGVSGVCDPLLSPAKGGASEKLEAVQLQTNYMGIKGFSPFWMFVIIIPIIIIIITITIVLLFLFN